MAAAFPFAGKRSTRAARVVLAAQKGRQSATNQAAPLRKSLLLPLRGVSPPFVSLPLVGPKKLLFVLGVKSNKKGL
jgi:hypothetical protein